MSKASVRSYIPKQSPKGEVMVDRGFLFTIIHTIEPNYFTCEMQRLEQERLEASQKVKEDQIEVQPEILELLQQWGAARTKQSKKVGPRSLALLKTNTKKRSRADFLADNPSVEREEKEIFQTIPSKRMRLND